jgi:4-carboxymuconolactone decarboxylase
MPKKKKAPSERYERGMKVFKRLYGDMGFHTLASLEEVTPDLAGFIVEFAFGDVFSRPGLDLKSRELVTIAALTTLGNAPKQLRAHIQGALSAGCTQQEIIEVILQMAVYAGFPAALNGIQAAKEAFGQTRAGNSARTTRR